MAQDGSNYKFDCFEQGSSNGTQFGGIISHAHVFGDFEGFPIQNALFGLVI